MHLHGFLLRPLQRLSDGLLLELQRLEKGGSPITLSFCDLDESPELLAKPRCGRQFYLGVQVSGQR